MFKITSLNSLSVVLKIGIGFVTSKLLAIFVGPSGMALVGNLRNFITSLESISTLGFQNGIIKYVTENQEDKDKLNKVITTVFFSLLVVAIATSSVIFGFANYWNYKIFGSEFEYSFVIKVLGIALPWYALSIFFLSVINGLGQYRNVILINIFGNLLGLMFSFILIYNFRTTGALLSVVIAPALLFLLTFYFINLEIKILTIINIHYFDFQILKKLSSFSIMALVSSVFGPIVYLLIRKNIILKLGLIQAGYWESISRISSYYLLFVSTILTIYFLPKLIQSKNNQETKMVFWSYFKFILPIFIFGSILIYFSRFIIIKILFTDDFLPVNDLFFWQLIGDVFKVASLILGYQFFAKKMTLLFIISEILSLLVLYFSSIFLLEIYGIQGVVIGQAIDNFLYLIVLVFIFRKSLF
ncbi:MAG: O-antigen translocase [Flavobacterium sp.]|nr:O-antigen translocase [Flavobacterium sp.]